MQIVNLAAAQRFAQHSLFDQRDVVFANKGLDRQATGWRRSYDRQVTHTAHGHIEGAGNRCSSKCEHVNFGTQRLDGLFLLHPEAVLLIDNQQAKVGKAKVALQKFVRAYQDIGFSRGHALADLCQFLARFEARYHFHADVPVCKAVTE